MKYRSINKNRILWWLFGVYCIVLFIILFMRKQFDIGLPYWEQVKMSINLVPFRSIYGSVYLIIHRTTQYLISREIISLLGNFALFMPFGYFIRNRQISRRMDTHGIIVVERFATFHYY